MLNVVKNVLATSRALALHQSSGLKYYSDEGLILEMSANTIP